jgi:type II secretory pathway component PulK
MNDMRKEDGYILVVVIGILTILSLMAITFATLSRIETRATRNYTDSVKCEMVAKAGLEHALYVLRLDKFGADTTAYNGDNGDENYDWSGETWMPGGGEFSGTDYDNDGIGGSESEWIYLPGTATATSAIRLPGKLVARYAILITDDREARVNINVTGNKAGGGAYTSNEGWSTFEIDLSNIIELAATGKGIATASDIIDSRFGTDTLPGAIGDDNPGIIPNPQTDGIDNDGDLIADEALEDTDEPNEFNPIYPFGDDRPFGFLTEAEIMGTSSYTSRLETIFNNRSISLSDQASLQGWLTTYSADTMVCPPYTLDGGTSTTMLNINALVNNEGAYMDTGAYDSDKKVNMLIDVLTVGGVPDVERQQLAVNIKDFIDSDGTVTTYSDGADTYYGVERTPYINEVEAEVTVLTSSGNGKFIELFNPYDTTIDLSNWTINFGTNTVNVAGTIGSQTYYVIADTAQAYVTDFNYNGGAPADQYDASINNLTTTGEILTFKDNNNNIVQVTNYGQAEIDTKTRQLNDPRPTPLMNADGSSNVDASIPWRWSTSLETAGGINTTTFNPTVGSDGWENITPTWPDSFLVADRRFSNKGYLGFIHNGRQWSSFLVDSNIVYPNVFQYFTVTDQFMDNIDNDGDNDIDSVDTGTQSGDIDGQEYRIPGLINVNTAPAEVLESLPNITNAIAIAIEGSGSKPFTSIGDLVDDVTEITGTGTKWNKEEAFRSISNLITTRSNVFTVYVTAQITDEAMSTVYAEKRIVAIVDRSVDPIKVRYFRWITE